MKNCDYCKKEFNPISNRGTEQKYCSTVCRNKSGQERYKQKLINNGISKTTEPSLSANIETEQFVSQNNFERRGGISHTIGGTNDNDIIRLLETNYQTKSELIRAELKLENALNELAKLRMENAELEEELNSEPTREGIIGMLNDIPDWAGGALGNLLKSEKIVKFVEGLIPEKQ